MKMRSALIAGSFVLAMPAASLADGAAPEGQSPRSASLDIPFERYELPNGLTVILSEDHTVPIVSVNVMVKVGSRFEADKRTGFAHLFEHLMFMGTDRVPTGKFDEWMEGEGGSNNAWTSEDRTDFYDVGPAHTLPLLLYLEGDRLDALGKTMTQEKLDAQRKVVRNERRQRSENEPYGKVDLRLPELLYPEGHPYHHPVIGSHEDLEAASVGDVKAFFGTYYVPSNMSLVVAGDFDSKDVKPLVERYFGGLAKAAPPPAPSAVAAPKLTTVVRETIEDNVKLPKIVMSFHAPPRFSQGDADLDVLADVLEEGKSSRLYKALVYDRQLAQSVSASESSQDLSSHFDVEVIGRPGVDLDDLEKAIDKELTRLAAEPVSAEELERAKNDYETSFVHRLESTEHKASLLNSYQTWKSDPGFIAKDLERYRSVTRESLFATAKSVLDLKGRVILRVVPKKEPPATPAEKGGKR